MTMDRSTRSDLLHPGRANARKPVDPDNPPARPTVFLSGGEMKGPEGPRIQRFWDMAGQETDRTEIAVARTTDRNKKVRYEVRVSTTGHDRNGFVDPYGVYFDPNKLMTTDRTTQKEHYEYRVVTQSVFEDYLRYLTGHDATFLRRAQRAYLNND